MKNIKKIVSTALIGIFALSFAGCNMVEKTPQAVAKSAVAKVNGEKITRDELDKNYQMVTVINQVKQQYGENYSSNTEAKDVLKEQKGKILDNMIDERILLQKAKELKVVPEEAKLTEDVNTKFNEIKKVYGDDEKKFEEATKQAGFTTDSLKAYLKNNVIIDKLIENITKDIKVDDNKAKEYYNSHQMEYTEKPNTMDLSHILVKTEDEAKKVKERLDKGENFETVAKEVSTDPGSKDKGGDLGTVNLVNSGFDQQFMAAAMTLNEGAVSGPVQTQFGYHIIKVRKKTNYPVKSFDSVKEDIKKTLLDDEKSKEFQKKLDEWKKASKITKYDKNLI